MKKSINNTRNFFMRVINNEAGALEVLLLGICIVACAFLLVLFLAPKIIFSY